MTGFRFSVFEIIQRSGRLGATSSEIACSLGRTVVAVNGAIQPLLRAGRIRRGEQKRKLNRFPATVWVATDGTL